MTTLARRLQEIPAQRTATGLPRRLTFGELHRLAPFCGDDKKPGETVRSSVLFLVRDVSLAVAALTQLDGAVERIFLAPTNLSPETLEQLSTSVGCDTVITDLQAAAGPGGLKTYLIGPQSPLPSLPPDASRPAVETRWLLATTGTTGLPKIVGHRLDSLIKTTKQNLVAEGTVRWGLLYDFTRFAGLQVLLQSLLSGATLLAPAAELGIERQTALLTEAGCTHLSATPTLWRKLLMTSASDRLSLRQITLGGEIADQRILSALRTRFPEARIAHIYASTESGVGFSVSDNREGFPADYLTNPPHGIALRVKDGRLQVRNTDVDASYVGSSDRFVADDGFIDTNDLVELRGDRYVFLGRANGVINVGGNKVHPEQVEHILLQCPEVAEARVYAKKNSFTGALVAADVVPRQKDADEQTLRATLTTACRAALHPYQVPAVIRFLKEIETNAAGKVSRQTP
jgi:acyl-CoA synthetase (AMP-forming)/AMP-acid ligase II